MPLVIFAILEFVQVTWIGNMLWYDGYDPEWILGTRWGSPAEPEPPPPPPPPPPTLPPDEEKVAAVPEPPKPIKLKSPSCCEGCEEKMKTVFIGLDGLESVAVDFESGLVTITGNVQSEECLNLAKRVVKRTVMW
ncbi:hypothetical protein MPTK1_3g03560 [Marchantia polymorpha subsp. ruderalis]|uniref:HMA domain-containing protein n=2 Tax=Marchantia polymorpha TaxID=3197 RepID=A0A176VFQ5_MARPO|nr:hypothetical protein AXG93_2958s1140 [Marchantia polymorpha subsp. ruderalis]PTQ44091.1 hypothetical protein MARPO_0022s0176 [Marchantia polymorpha]BBN04314.1 hypothetical protein Mp_3g03560 [Marchantia polymorpha subsp. ruderalis]|eukprot:PTQ44091.1 hypothetical protein MARPO_0022s0176 [Marchantia polymorpha]